MTTSDLFEYAKNSLRKLSHPKKSLNSVRSGQPTPPPPPPPSRWELYPVTCKKTNVKQGAHIHQQPTAWLIPHACRQIYHPGSGSRGPFRPYCGSSGIFFFAASPLSRAPDKPPCYAGYVTTDHCDASCPLIIWCRYAFSVKSNWCARQASASRSRQVYEIQPGGGLHHPWAKNSGYTESIVKKIWSVNGKR